MSQERKSCNLQPSPILAAREYVRSVRCLEATATSDGGFQAICSSCQAPEGNKDPPGALTKPLLTIWPTYNSTQAVRLQHQRPLPAQQNHCQGPLWGQSSSSTQPDRTRHTFSISWSSHQRYNQDGEREQHPELLSVLKHSHQRSKLEGKQVSWRLPSPSKETARVLAAGGFMEIYNTSAACITRLIKWLDCFGVSFLQILGKHLHLPRDHFCKLS